MQSSTIILDILIWNDLHENKADMIRSNKTLRTITNKTWTL